MVASLKIRTFLNVYVSCIPTSIASTRRAPSRIIATERVMFEMSRVLKIVVETINKSLERSFPPSPKLHHKYEPLPHHNEISSWGSAQTRSV